jgi:hypothetical protein
MPPPDGGCRFEKSFLNRILESLGGQVLDCEPKPIGYEFSISDGA